MGRRRRPQAWGIIEALNILEQCVPQWYPGQSLGTLGPANPLFWHALVETKKVAYADTYAFNADPDVVSVPVGTLTSKPYAASLCGKVNPGEASATAPPSFDPVVGGFTGPAIGGDTIYLSTADRWGNMVSWIDSNFTPSGLGSRSLVMASSSITGAACSHWIPRVPTSSRRTSAHTIRSRRCLLRRTTDPC